MWKGRIASAALAATLAIPGLTSCAHNQAGGQLAPANAVTVDVNNQNFYSMDVYLVSDGLPTRLGTVNSNHEESFVLDPSVISQDLRIVAAPIGGNGRASTGTIVAAPGQTIEFRIAPLLRNSTTYIR
ncbi:MAG TPA: hypothetical protein VHB25_13505 [Gemmatimonadaceae bacterium]|nr:hypothetical protein [Gemmatimonadaceae bacterium]